MRVHLFIVLSQARNILANDIHVGDVALFYHSNCKDPGIAGIMEVSTTCVNKVLVCQLEPSWPVYTGSERGISRYQPV